MIYLCLLHKVSVGGGSTVIYVYISRIKIVFQLILLQLKDNKATNQPIKVKISGDGARMSHTSNLFVMSLSLLDDGPSCLSSSGKF